MAKTFFQKILLGIIIVIGVVILDQSVKTLIRHLFLPGESVYFLRNIGLTFFENSKGPFSLPLPLPLSILTSVMVLAFLITLFFRQAKISASLKLLSALALVIGGGISNTFDRVWFQTTLDYIALPFGGFWNLADIAIALGLLILILSTSQRPSRS